MCRHIFNWNIVACDVKQPISLSLSLSLSLSSLSLSLSLDLSRSLSISLSLSLSQAHFAMQQLCNQDEQIAKKKVSLKREQTNEYSG